jgi:hypothetical protein
MLDKIGFKHQVENWQSFPQSVSNRGYSTVSFIETFLVSVWYVKLVANLWLRSGNTGSSEGFLTFLEDTLSKLQGKSISLLSMDSGFRGKEIII